MAWLGHVNIVQTSTYLSVSLTGAEDYKRRLDTAPGFPHDSHKPIEQPPSDTADAEGNEQTQTVVMSEFVVWCGREDLNLHDLAATSSEASSASWPTGFDRASSLSILPPNFRSWSIVSGRSRRTGKHWQSR
jgi:hypothetical protein